MKNKPTNRLLLCITAISFCACNGPRYIHSVSPLLSPVPLEKGSTSVAADYFTHNKPADSVGDHDNAFAFTVAHMLKKKVMLSATVDVKKEKDVFHFAPDSLYRVTANGGFDSSIVNTKRYTAGLGVSYFFHSPDEGTKTISGIAGSLNLHHMQLAEAGQLKNNPYHRYFNEYQVAFSLQYNILRKLGKRINIAYIARLSFVKLINPKTDFTEEEQFNTGLGQGEKIQVYPSLISGYIGYKPFKNIPLYAEGQLFNEVALWEHTMAKNEKGRPNIKGSGISIGLKYTLP